MQFCTVTRNACACCAACFFEIAGQKPGECESAVSGGPGRQRAHQQNASRGQPSAGSRSVHFLLLHHLSFSSTRGIYVSHYYPPIFIYVFLLGNINQSLMTLRTCIEVLRENQMCGTNKVCDQPFFGLGHFVFCPSIMVHSSSRWCHTGTPKSHICSKTTLTEKEKLE